MRIRSLEIAGFKSFADRVVLAFDQGTSAIVGPNGCGKSNVVDAVRWVMGEQNPRHLRGRLMDDIIFSGTETRAPVGLAEVVLTLDAADGRVPPDYAGFPEIQVARRLYRSGESEYLINRVPCRLRDVVELFLDTGVGTRGYTIVEQGQIASIVSTRPEDRRFIVEEAAGISKYRQRRRETERKLESTEQNLLRVNDILGELKRQISALDRQARRAARYKELSAQLRDLELGVAHEELCGQRDRLREAERDLEGVRTEAAALDARLARAEALLESERRSHLDRERELQGHSERLYALRSEIDSLENRIEYEGRERDGLLRLAEQRDGEIAEREGQVSDQERALTLALEEIGFADERLAREAEEVERRSEDLRRKNERLAELQGRREAAQALLTELSAEAAALDSRGTALEERRREVEVRLRQEDEALEQSAQQAEGLAREEQTLAERLRGAMDEQGGLGRQLAEMLRAHQEHVVRLEAHRAELGGVRETLQERTTRLEALREADERESSRAVEMLEELPADVRGKLRGMLSEVVRIEDGLERALETALGGRLDAVLVDDSRSALALLDWLRGEQAGRVTVLTAREGDAAPLTAFVPLGRPLLDAVTIKPPYEPLVRRLLGDVYVVDDLAAAVDRFGAGEPPATFVTAAGEVLDRSGALTGGSRAAPGTLQRAADIRRLEHEVEQLRGRREELERAVTLERQGREALERDLENTRSRRHTAALAVLNLEKDLERARERCKESAVSGEQHREAKAGLVAELERVEAERRRVGERAAELERERTVAETSREQVAAEVGGLDREIERLEQRLVQQKVEVAQLGSRRAELVASRDRLQSGLQEAREWLRRLREEVAGARRSAAQLEGSLAEASQGLAERIGREESVRVQQEALRSAYGQSGERVDGAESEARAATRDRDALRERLSAAELAAQEARMRCERVVERVRERYSIDLERYEPPADAPRGEHAARLEEVNRLRQSLDALGPVNLASIEEYEEVSERHRYLTEQKADLELSVERLRNAILRINRTSRQRFRQTFEAVDAEFQKLFPKLFRGGRAHLSLTESEDVLEAGIEITAQPPGKKLQNVNLLSGGEKSLTALALLFSVFAVKPSPFFMLDEVDAALDDANVRRFDDLVREMSRASQFLLITHNKSTIESADKLFGVTMEEPGLSKLVTVDLVS